MQLKGIVTQIIYKGNNFFIFKLLSEGETFIVKSNFPVLENEFIQIEGDFEFNPKYGKQFIAKKLKPTTNLDTEILSINGIAHKTWEKLRTIPNLNNIINKNPFELAFKYEVINYKKADLIAQHFKINENIRKNYAVFKVLNDFLEQGHTTYPISEVLKKAENLINKTIKIDELDSKLFYIWENFFISIRNTAKIEANIAKNIAKRFKNKNIFSSVILRKKLFDFFSQIKEISPDKKELSKFLDTPITIITGGPGTGKTTILKYFLKFLNSENLNFRICAPTGKAARRIEEITGFKAYTIHKFLISNLLFNNFDVLIIDESSFLSIDIFNWILQRISLKTKIILIGDCDQLPPVEAGNVLNDLIESKLFPVLKLQTQHRTATSDIPQAALKVKNKIFPKPSENFKIIYTEPENLFKIVKNFKNYQFLSAMNKGKTGTTVLNNYLKKINNPTCKNQFCINDKVIWIKNDYQLMLFNGQIGIIKDIAPTYLEINFDGDIVKVPNSKLSKLKLAYCITIHKSQGSEFNKVAISLFKEHFILFSRKLLYTAITRAKEKVVIICDKKSLHILLNSKNEENRFTLLKNFLNKYCNFS